MNIKEIYLNKPWLKFYAEGVPNELDVPQKSVPELLDTVAKKYGSKAALIFYGKKITYRKLKEGIDRFAAALHDIGIKKGNTVALYLLNCPQYVISYFAILKIGATVTPVSPVYTSREVKHQLENSEAKAIICEDILYDNVEMTGIELDNVVLCNIKDYLPVFKKLFGKNNAGNTYKKKMNSSKSSSIYFFKDLIKKYLPAAPDILIDPKKDIAALSYTGGTTGLPKAAVLTHYNMVSLQAQALAPYPFIEEGKEVIIAFLPFSNIYGQVVLMLSGLATGATIVLFTTPDFHKIIAATDRYKGTVFYGVPALFEYLKGYDKTTRVNWQNLKIIVSGADTLHESTVKEWERRTGTRILEGYGMTETTSVSHITPHNRPKTGTFGVPIPNVNAAIIDSDGSDFMPVGEVGELILQGPNIMQGYWKRPDDNKRAFVDIDGEKWFRTGDLVCMDDEGYFYFIDRKRDLIKHKGYSVFARHVEEVLCKHPKIKSAGVVGIPDPKVGNQIKAYVVLHSEARGRITTEEITAFCKKNMAHYKIPDIIEFRGELPKTDMGKVSRRELRDESEVM
ncbi:MAG: long-chain fatty acid--CoA ligase [Deltaproteobacteria bacterium]|nr:long-chain fatty acid--CoA ligase [Deltaproteobacteria bacterium]